MANLKDGFHSRQVALSYEVDCANSEEANLSSSSLSNFAQQLEIKDLSVQGKSPVSASAFMRHGDEILMGLLL